MVAEATPARIKVPQSNPHLDDAPRGVVGRMVALSARGSGGSASLGFLDVAGGARSTVASLDFVLQLQPRRTGALSVAGAEFVRSCIGELCRRVFQELGGRLKATDLACSPDGVGVKRQIRELTSVGRIPGRRAPAIMALPVAGLYFDSESHCGDGAESSPMKVVVGVGRSVLQFFVCCFLPPPGHASVFSLLMVSVYFGACNLVLVE